MANVFGILTAIVLALAGFVAYKNKAAYENEIYRKRATTRQTTSELESKTQGPNWLQKPFPRTAWPKPSPSAPSVDAEVVKQTEMETAQKKTNDGLDAGKRGQDRQGRANKVKLDDIREKTAKVGDLKELASKMRATKAELEEIAQSITATEAKLANLTALNNQAENQVTASKVKFERYRQRPVAATLNTRIRSIYPTWGFVTLAAGNNAGVVANSTLDVVRDGSTIAKLLVTSVESSTASASIIPDSIARTSP